MDFLLVGIGGMFGSLSRYKLGKLISEKSTSRFPTGTFIINITGALLLGVVSGLDTDKNSYLLLGDGFLGAYTTFSTFMYEGVSLIRGSRKMNALAYISGSLCFGIAGYIIGFLTVHILW